MEIKVFGPGCKRCHETNQVVRDAVVEANLDIEVQYITDFQEMAKHGIFTTPAVSIDGEVKCEGKVPKKQDVLAWLKG